MAAEAPARNSWRPSVTGIATSYPQRESGVWRERQRWSETQNTDYDEKPAQDRHPHPKKPWSSRKMYSQPSGLWKTSPLARTLRSKFFQGFMHCVIVANTMVIGMELTARINGEDDPVWEYFEHVFIVIFVAELYLRVMVDGCFAFRQHAMWFDTCLVVVAVLSQWVLPALSLFMNVGDASRLGLALVLRSARLARLARALRLLECFVELWMLVNAFLSSTKIMIYVILLLFVVLFVFSAAAAELITIRYANMEDVPPDVMDHIHKWFPSVLDTMLTLFHFATLDNISEIYYPLIKYDWTLTLFFVTATLVISIVLMNIVTAVIVNSAIEQSAEDREYKRQEEKRRKDRHMKLLYEVFQRLDSDGSGTLDLNELCNVGGEDAEILQEFVGDMDVVEIFSMLDLDGGGRLDIEEFCEGLYQAVVCNHPIVIKRMEKQVVRLTKLEAHLTTMEALPRQLVKVLKEYFSSTEFKDFAQRSNGTSPVPEPATAFFAHTRRECESVWSGSESRAAMKSAALPKDKTTLLPQMCQALPLDLDAASFALPSEDKVFVKRDVLQRSWDLLHHVQQSLLELQCKLLAAYTDDGSEEDGDFAPPPIPPSCWAQKSAAKAARKDTLPAFGPTSAGSSRGDVVSTPLVLSEFQPSAGALSARSSQRTSTLERGSSGS